MFPTKGDGGAAQTPPPVFILQLLTVFAYLISQGAAPQMVSVNLLSGLSCLPIISTHTHTLTHTDRQTEN